MVKKGLLNAGTYDWSVIADFCYFCAPLGLPKRFDILSICALGGRPRSFVRLHLHLRPWGKDSTVTVPRAHTGATGRQHSWVRVSALLVASPFLPGHRSPPQPHVSPVGPSARPPSTHAHVPLFPAPGVNPETGTPTPLVNMPRAGIFSKVRGRVNPGNFHTQFTLILLN
jgi:hypothetical protein